MGYNEFQLMSAVVRLCRPLCAKRLKVFRQPFFKKAENLFLLKSQYLSALCNRLNQVLRFFSYGDNGEFQSGADLV